MDLAFQPLVWHNYKFQNEIDQKLQALKSSNPSIVLSPSYRSFYFVLRIHISHTFFHTKQLMYTAIQFLYTNIHLEYLSWCLFINCCLLCNNLELLKNQTKWSHYWNLEHSHDYILASLAYKWLHHNHAHRKY